jgi:predicted nucleic acid-binding protein
MVIDTDILIDHFHGNAQATAFVRDALIRGESLIISVATVVEILAGLRQGEEDATNDLLSLFTVQPADEPIGRVAGAFLNRYGREYRLDLGDALIAATAQATGMTLYTRNIRHYPMVEIKVEEPYQRGR